MSRPDQGWKNTAIAITLSGGRKMQPPGENVQPHHFIPADLSGWMGQDGEPLQGRVLYKANSRAGNIAV